MRFAPYFALAALLLLQPARAQEVTGLSGWSIFLDPGHSQNENVGAFGYSEARKVLRVGLELRSILQSRTDIGAVYMSRTNDQQNVSLSQRVDAANQSGASFFHSIHSNAAAPSVNNVFVLWPQRPDGSEGIPNGGRRMAEIMGPALAQGMRIPAANGGIGAFGECDFYGASTCGTGPKGSRNFVQRNTVMASALSEAGYHTNPTQNQRNMNAEWKRLEAQAMFWSILAFHNLPRPMDRIATGIVADAESGRPVNGAVVTIGGQTYTTDTYESLFNQFSTDPNELSNGFYYLENLPAGTLPVTVSAAGFRPYAGEVTMLERAFTFHDVALVSTVPPVVAQSTPAAGAVNVRVTDPLTLRFSRPMNPATTQPAFSLVPAGGGAPVTGTLSLLDGGTRLEFRPAAPLQAQTTFTLTLAGSATGVYGDALDGNGDGTAGDDFVLTFTTGAADTRAPRLEQVFPANNATGVVLRPVVTVAFDELVQHASLTGRVVLEVAATGAPVPGRVQIRDVRGGEGRTVVSFAPDAPLAPSTAYRFAFEEGVTDLFGNATSGRLRFTFTTGTTDLVATSIDDFEGAFTSHWWAPQQSGSTTGIVTDSTGMAASQTTANLLGGQQSMRLRYGWAESGPWLIRQFLNSGPAFQRRFDNTYVLQAYVFGDGSGTRFRFAVDDRCSGSTCAGTEVSPWYTIDWYGWRAISWDLAAGQTGSWIGDGTLDGEMRFDSIQLTYGGQGSARFGELFIDDLRLLRLQAVSSEDGPPLAGGMTLEAPYPNPFGSETTIRFSLGEAGPVTARVFNLLGQHVATLADGEDFGQGAHELTWAPRGLASGVYVLRVEAAGRTETRRLVLAR